MAEIDKIKVRIFNLMQKTVENGCSHAEAMMAMQKAGELMDFYNLSLSDIHINNDKCVRKNFQIPTKSHAFTFVAVPLAKYCDVKVWQSDKTISIFGLPADCDIFEYFFNIIFNTMKKMEVDYKKSDEYNSIPEYVANRRGYTLSYMRGVANGFIVTLNKMIEAKAASEIEKTGRSLVLVKSVKIEEEFKKTIGIKLYNKKRSFTTQNSFYTGFNDGKKVALNNGVTGNTRGMIG